ncbi:MAG: arginine--tRNA ligase [Anaerolineaceae bacterium]|nr:arginine--tRNA ligase [Anaerolineaceae bacterium]
MFKNEQKDIQDKIHAYCREHGLPDLALEWKGIPFSGQWGISTSFFKLAAQEVRSGKKINVAQRAQEIALSAADFLGDQQGFERIEAVQGYLNLYFSSAEYLKRVVDAVLEEGDNFGCGEHKNKRVMVEFSQPNTHKAFHVGHLRNVILGNAICNILDCAGFEVIRANYLGDIGLHVIQWLWNYQKHHADEEPGVDKIRWIGDIYVEAEQYYSESPEVEAEVRQLFRRWDRRDPEVVSLWEKTRQWSIEGFDQVYQLLDVHFDRVYFESEVEEPGKEIVKDLIKRGIARDERPEGAVIIPLDEILGTKEKFRVMVVLRSDGTSLYSTKDLALAVQKFEEYELERSIYIIDVRQSLHFQQIFKTLEIMGLPWADRCYHLPYELVNLPGSVTMKSREGTVVLFEDLIREATQRALDIVKIKNPDLTSEKQEDIARLVALGAIKYPMVSRDNTKTLTFDWDTALDFNGQTSPYIQYAYVRAGSILRRANWKLPGSQTPNYELHPTEIELIDVISRFPKEVQRAAEELRPIHIANLSYELAKAFSDFYRNCPVLQEDEQVMNMRLRLVYAARQALKNVLGLIGIDAPEAM